MAKYKKVIVQKVEDKPVETKIKWWIYKVPNRLFLHPIPYEISIAQKEEIIKLIKFCK